MKALASRILLLAPVWLVLMTVAALGQTPTASTKLGSFLEIVPIRLPSSSRTGARSRRRW